LSQWSGSPHDARNLPLSLSRRAWARPLAGERLVTDRLGRMLEVTAEGWAATLAVIFGLLILDWVVLGRRSRTVGLVGAARWSAFYVAISAAFGLVFGLLNGSDLATQYFAGYRR
jgi:hypothetical protein